MAKRWGHFKCCHINNVRFKKDILETILLVSNNTSDFNYLETTFDGRLAIFSEFHPKYGSTFFFYYLFRGEKK